MTRQILQKTTSLIKFYIRNYGGLMPNTFTQIHIHIVFTVKDRNCLISSEWKNKLYAYITGIVQSYGHKLVAINGTADHIHIFIDMQPVQSISDLVKNIKRSSSIWIKDNGLVKGFNWQEGYGAFSHSHSQIYKVIEYILNQEKHHNRRTFKEEYLELLKKFGVKYEDKYLFKWISD